MKISDELREWADVHCGEECEEYLGLLADRIDAEMVELPKDKDGVPIHVRDTLDGYGKTIEVVEMRYGRGGWVLISRDGSGYADTFAFAHHHKPTVEGILRDFGVDIAHALDADPDATVPEAIIAEYAAKLRLVGDAE